MAQMTLAWFGPLSRRQLENPSLLAQPLGASRYSSWAREDPQTRDAGSVLRTAIEGSQAALETYREGEMQGIEGRGTTGGGGVGVDHDLSSSRISTIELPG